MEGLRLLRLIIETKRSNVVHDCLQHYNTNMAESHSRLQEAFPYIKEGVYTPPREVKIGTVPGVIVDPHNEVFNYWEKFLHGKKATLMHVDAHADMQANIPPIEATIVSSGQSLMDVYSQRVLTIQSFIAAGVHHGMIGSIYGYNPRREEVDFYGPDFQTEVRDGEIQWAGEAGDGFSPVPTPLSLHEVAAQVEESRPLLLDIDLDAFACITDPKYVHRDDQRRTLDNANSSRKDQEYDYQIEMHFERVLRLLSTMPKPIGISIARSQTPYVYAPSERVDMIESGLLQRLTQLYT